MTIIVISSKYLTNTSLQSRMFPMTAIMVLDESRQHNNSIDRLVHTHGNKQNPTSNIKEQPFKWQMLQCPLRYESGQLLSCHHLTDPVIISFISTNVNFHPKGRMGGMSFEFCLIAKGLGWVNGLAEYDYE